MIGPEHYRAAEELLWRVCATPDNVADVSDVSNAIALAQVHATLALASATALAIDPTPEAVALWDALVLDEDTIDEIPGEEDTRCSATTDAFSESLACLLPADHGGWHKGIGSSWSPSQCVARSPEPHPGERSL